MFYSELPRAQVIITCPSKFICDYCYQNLVLGDILDDGGNVDKQEDFEFSSSFFKKTSNIKNKINGVK